MVVVLWTHVKCEVKMVAMCSRIKYEVEVVLCVHIEYVAMMALSCAHVECQHEMQLLSRRVEDSKLGLINVEPEVPCLY